MREREREREKPERLAHMRSHGQGSRASLHAHDTPSPRRASGKNCILYHYHIINHI
jgi:hypothetical protein